MPTTAGTDRARIAFPRARLRGRRRGCARPARCSIGKTRMHEFAWGNVTPPGPQPVGRSTACRGGSSGGSGAAVAAGLCAGGARLRHRRLDPHPGRSLCGVVGLKPTFGRVSRDGIVPHSWSLDHAGPLTAHGRGRRHPAARARRLRSRATRRCRDAPVPDYRAGLGSRSTACASASCRNHFFERQPGRRRSAAVEAAIDDLAGQGATVVDFRCPNLAYGLGAIFAIELASSTAYHDVSLRDGPACDTTRPTCACSSRSGAS